MPQFRLGTRGSPLALTQAHMVRDALAAAQDRRTLSLSVPAGLVRLGARIDGLLRRGKAKLTPDRAAYFCHPDWTADPAKRPPAGLWQPAIPTPEGLEQTADWYCRMGWL